MEKERSVTALKFPKDLDMSFVSTIGSKRAKLRLQVSTQVLIDVLISRVTLFVFPIWTKCVVYIYRFFFKQKTKDVNTPFIVEHDTQTGRIHLNMIK